VLQSKVLQVTLKVMARNPQNLQVQASACAVLCDAARGQVRTHTYEKTLSCVLALSHALCPLSFDLFPLVSMSLARARVLFASLPFALSLFRILSCALSFVLSFCLSLFLCLRARGGKGLPRATRSSESVPGTQFFPVSGPRFLRRPDFSLFAECSLVRCGSIRTQSCPHPLGLVQASIRRFFGNTCCSGDLRRCLRSQEYSATSENNRACQQPSPRNREKMASERMYRALIVVALLLRCSDLREILTVFWLCFAPFSAILGFRV